jgi:hypothetical protein
MMLELYSSFPLILLGFVPQSKASIVFEIARSVREIVRKSPDKLHQQESPRSFSSGSLALENQVPN